MRISYDLAGLRKLLGKDIIREEGELKTTVTGIASLADAVAGDLSFLGNKKYTPGVKHTRASVILLPEDYRGEPAAGQLYIRCANPSIALARICAEIEVHSRPRPEAGIHASAVVAADARIETGVCIGPLCVVEAEVTIATGTVLQAGVFIGRGSQIGSDVWVSPGVSISEHCRLGDRVRIHANAVIGSDGFGYELCDGRQVKVPQIGNVVLEDDVEIGAGTTIDRARFDSTRIGEGTKIDNLVQIGHNVRIGKHCLLVSQVGVSGSTTLGDHVVLAGQAGITGHLNLADRTIVGAQAGIHFDTEAGKYYRGSPALEAILANRIHILQKRLPDLFKRVSQLELHLPETPPATHQS